VYNWVLGAALGPVNSALSAFEFTEFGREYCEKLPRAYPKGGKGVTLFPFKRIFMVVRR
jgi:trans-aconitate 2-methyltransferase